MCIRSEFGLRAENLTTTPSLTEYRPTALSAAKEGCGPGLAMYGHCLAIQRQRHSEGLGLYDTTLRQQLKGRHKWGGRKQRKKLTLYAPSLTGVSGFVKTPMGKMSCLQHIMSLMSHYYYCIIQRKRVAEWKLR